jgi:hypothetical protein
MRQRRCRRLDSALGGDRKRAFERELNLAGGFFTYRRAP